jgi:hypothetical protein
LNDIQSIISDLERQRQAIDRAIAALRDVSGPQGIVAKRSTPVTGKKAARRRGISPEGKARIAEAQRQRWAAKRAAEQAAAKKTAAKKAAGKKTAAKKVAAKSAGTNSPARKKGTVKKAAGRKSVPPVAAKTASTTEA